MPAARPNRPESSRHRPDNRALGAVLIATGLLVMISGGCVDTTLPDLSRELGKGRTDAAYCAVEVMQALPAEELRIHLIDVGQGDAIWVQTPWFDDRIAESRNILIDAGPSGTVSGTAAGGDVVVNYMLSQGLVPGELLHAMVITHAHEDHFGGAQRVASVFDVGTWVDPGFTANSPGFLNTRNYVETRVAAINGRIARPAVPQLTSGLFRSVDIFGPAVQADLIWSADAPPGGNASNPSGTDINNTSVAFALRWGFRQVLLLGDIEDRAERELIAAHDAGEFNLRSSVLKVAHHGSSSSTSNDFLARVFGQAGNEDWAVISSGRRSFSGTTLPTPETLARLQAVMLPNHILSTENRDDVKVAGTEHNDDHIIVRITAEGLVEACYVP